MSNLNTFINQFQVQVQVDLLFKKSFTGMQTLCIRNDKNMGTLKKYIVNISYI